MYWIFFAGLSFKMANYYILKANLYTIFEKMLPNTMFPIVPYTIEGGS
jgi:hypothetical protein